MGSGWLPRTAGGVATNIIGDTISAIRNMPANATIDAGQKDLKNLAPSTSIPTGTLDERYRAAVDTATNPDGSWNPNHGTAAASGISATPGQFSAIQRQMEKYKRPDGSYDFAAASAAGVRLDLIGVDPTKLSEQDLANTRTRDADVALASAQGVQQNAIALGDDIQRGMASQNATINADRKTATNNFNSQRDSITAQQEENSLNPERVRQENLASAVSLKAMQEQQVKDLGSILGQGLLQMAGEKLEALKGISDNMANDLSASTQSVRNNMNAQLAQINSNPNMPPEARAKLSSQLSMQASMEAANAAAPVRRMYRELETNTRTAFAKIGADFISAGATASASLYSSQQTATGSLMEESGSQYANSLSNTAATNAALSGVLQSAEATRASSLANLETLRFQVNGTGNQLLAALLPLEAEPYINDSVLDGATFQTSLSVASLRYDESRAALDSEMVQLGMNNDSSAATVASLQNSQGNGGGGGGGSSSDGITAAGIGGGALVTSAAIEGGMFTAAAAPVAVAAPAAAATTTGLSALTPLITAGLCISGDCLLETPEGSITLRDVRVGHRIRSVHNQYTKVVAKHYFKVLDDTAPRYFEIHMDGRTLVVSDNHVVNGVLISDWMDHHPGQYKQFAPAEAGDLLLADGAPYMADGYRISSLLRFCDLPTLQLLEPENQQPPLEVSSCQT